MASASSISQWSMATHPQYDNARKRKLREERDSRSMVPLDSTDEVAAVRLSGGTAVDPRKTAVGFPLRSLYLLLIPSSFQNRM